MTTTTPVEAAWAEQKARVVAFDRIRADDNLSELGLQRAMYEAHVSSAGRLAELRGERVAEVEAERKRLTHRAFAAPTAADRPAYRAALEMADRLESPSAAEEALRRAERTDDPLLARAIATVAAERGWPVLKAYGDLFGQSEALDELEAFGAHRKDLSRSVDESMAFNAAAPPEAAGYRPPADVTSWWRG